MRLAALISLVTLPAVLIACGDSAPAPVAAPDRSQPAMPAMTQEAPSAPMQTTQSGMTFQAHDSSSAEIADGVINAAGVNFAIPEGWVSVTPSSSMRVAQFSIPAETGDAEVAFFCFGVNQGGNAQENISRWVGQFSDPTEPEIHELAKEDVVVTTVNVSGTFNSSMGPMMPSTPVEDQSLYGVIVEGGNQGSVFVKVTGPIETIEANLESLQGFAASASL